MNRIKILLVVITLMVTAVTLAQPDAKDLQRDSQTFRADASVAIAKDAFVEGEALYRKSISLEPADAASKYNLGNAYYKKEKNKEAMRRFVQAAEVAATKSEKHKAFHNLGNTLMNAEMYKEAVEAYKNALRNNPTDDETRYNLALAKEMLEKEQQNNGGGDNSDDKDEKEKDKEDESGKEGEEKDEEKKEDQQEDQQNQQDKGDQEEKKGDPKKNEQQQQQQQPQPGQLSPEQIESLLEAMNNEEQKVQQKMNLKKKKGAKKKTGKDW